MTVQIKFNETKGCLEVVSGKRVEATNIVTICVAKTIQRDLKSIQTYINDNRW